RPGARKLPLVVHEEHPQANERGFILVAAHHLHTIVTLLMLRYWRLSASIRKRCQEGSIAPTPASGRTLPAPGARPPPCLTGMNQLRIARVTGINRMPHGYPSRKEAM